MEPQAMTNSQNSPNAIHTSKLYSRGTEIKTAWHKNRPMNRSQAWIETDQAVSIQLLTKKGMQGKNTQK